MEKNIVLVLVHEPKNSLLCHYHHLHHLFLSNHHRLYHHRHLLHLIHHCRWLDHIFYLHHRLQNNHLNLSEIFFFMCLSLISFIVHLFFSNTCRSRYAHVVKTYEGDSIIFISKIDMIRDLIHQFSIYYPSNSVLFLLFNYFISYSLFCLERKNDSCLFACLSLSSFSIGLVHFSSFVLCLFGDSCYMQKKKMKRMECLRQIIFDDQNNWFKKKIKKIY